MMDYSDSLLLLTGYALVIMAASLVGGWLPSIVRMTHTRIQIAMCFVSGLILCVALYYLMPHAIMELSGEHAIETAARWMMAGVALMLLLLRLSPFHQHEFGEADDQNREHAPHKSHQENPVVHPMSWAGIALGLSLHTLTDGVALGTSIRAGASDGTVGVLGLSVFLAIVCHKPLDALSITGTMRAAGLSSSQRRWVNVVFALICPVGALLTFWGVGLFGQGEDYVVGCALAFAAGALLCIALSDLLPEVHFHRHDRLKLTLSFFSGIGLAYVLHYIEPSAIHGHGG